MRLPKGLWPQVKMFGPLAAIVAVVVIVFITDLMMDGGEGSTPENDAALGPGVAAASPLPPTEVAPSISPTPAPVTPTAAPTAVSGTVASTRDETRKADLGEIKLALEKYHDEEDEYPNTGGNIATACIFPDLDPLCDLDEYLDELPSDPRGDPSKNGYWYTSDGKTYTVIAEVELPQNATPTVCPANVARALGRDYLYCVTDK